MVLQNKLGITESAKLAREEERISKIKAIELFNKNILVDKKAGTFDTLSYIHEFLFSDIYEFAGKVRVENIAKDNFRFAPVMFLNAALNNIDKMPQNTFEQIIEKYVEMNIMHSFYEGNGRATKIWLDQMLIKRLGMCVNWQNISRNDYLSAMKRSVINDLELKFLLKENLTEDVESRDVFMNGINQSYEYENMRKYDVLNI